MRPRTEGGFIVHPPVPLIRACELCKVLGHSCFLKGVLSGRVYRQGAQGDGHSFHVCFQSTRNILFVFSFQCVLRVYMGFSHKF